MAVTDNGGCWHLTVAIDGSNSGVSGGLELHLMVMEMDNGKVVVRGCCSGSGRK